MFDLKLLMQLIAPEDRHFPGARMAAFEELMPEGATLGTLYIGRPGTGKTTSLARHLVDSFKQFPEQAIFVLDWSGSISDAILSLISQEPKEMRDGLIKRLVYDEMGHPEWIVPLPEFSPQYGLDFEEQVQRLAGNLVQLAPDLVQNAPVVAGLGLREIAPEIFRLLTAIRNEFGETWQVTEAKRLIKDGRLLKEALAKYGQSVPQAKWYLENAYKGLHETEKDLRTYSIISLLGAIETPAARARVGYYRPGWTPREAIEKGMLVLINGARLINQRNSQHYLFTQAYSMIMAEINKRVPGDPNDRPVALVMDEVYSLLSVPGMAEEIGMLSPLYRSRKLELYVVLQSLSQLAATLRAQIWSLGNIVAFAVANFEEAYELAQQIFKYTPEAVKMAAKTDTQQPVIEPDRGQYLLIANDIQRMKHRECIVRRYLSERVLDKHVLWVQETRSVPQGISDLAVAELKDNLLRERGVRIRDALQVVNERNLGSAGPAPTTPPGL